MKINHLTMTIDSKGYCLIALIIMFIDTIMVLMLKLGVFIYLFIINNKLCYIVYNMYWVNRLR